MPRRAPYERFKRCDMKVAGVSFPNEKKDGGENRQDLLKQLTGEPSMVRLEPCTFFRTETRQWEPAIKVRSLKLNKIIGYVPKDRIEEFRGRQDMILRVELYKGTYGAILTRPEQPSAKQYGTVMAMAREGRIRQPRLYDKTSYQWAISSCMEAH